MKKSVLIVDDTPQNIQILASILTEKGFDIEFALNGNEGLQLLSTVTVDIILLDVMMPELDGFDTCKTIRQQSKYDEIPIIFLTARADKDSIYAGFEMGAQDYITKPFDSRELLARIKTQLELKEARQKLKTVNSWLENEVFLRTNELVETNKKLEEANKELLGLDALKSDFLAIISHEIRTPLNGINGALQLLKHHVDSIKLFKFIELLDTSITRLERFSLIALRITALKTGKYVLNKDVVNLSELIELATIKMADLLTEKSVKLKFSTLPETLVVKGDYELISFCLESLLENAISFTKSGTTVNVESKVDQEGIEMSFINQGEHYSVDEMKDIFTFFNSVNSLDDSPGLGLPFSKLIVNAHGGSLNVFNNEGAGTTSIIRFCF